MHIGYGNACITVDTDIDRVNDVIKAIETLCTTGNSSVSSAVHASAVQVAARARAMAPNKTGVLRSGIVVKPGREKSSRPGATVYDIWMDPGLNQKFVKYSKAGKRYYYPASMEYGFRLRNGKRAAGHYYLKNAAVGYSETHAQRMAEAISGALDEAQNK